MSTIRSVCRFAFLTVSFCVSGLAWGQQDCSLKKQKNDLKVFTCETDSGRLKTLRAEFILEHTTFDELKEFMLNVSNYVNWQYNTIEAKVLDKPPDHSIVYRVVVEAPWPLSNREMITKLSIHFDSTARQLTITNHNIAFDFPRNKELVRVPFSDGIMLVRQLDTSSLKVFYSLRIDPGGNVPAWLVNIAMAEGPFYSFTKLKEKLRQ